MIDDLLKSAQQTIMERLANPILGSFAVSWCLWNYKFLMVVFSANRVTQTVSLIETVAYPNIWALVGRGVVGPLITAGVYIFLYPYPALWIYRFTLQRQRETNRVKREVDEETPMTVKESRELRQEVFELERAHAGTVDSLNQEVKRWKDLAGALQLKYETPAPPGRPKSQTQSVKKSEAVPRLTHPQEGLLTILGERDGKVPADELAKLSNLSKVQFDYEVTELESIDFIKRTIDLRPNAGMLITLTHKGAGAYLKIRQEAEARPPDEPLA